MVDWTRGDGEARSWLPRSHERAYGGWFGPHVLANRRGPFFRTGDCADDLLRLSFGRFFPLRGEASSAEGPFLMGALGGTAVELAEGDVLGDDLHETVFDALQQGHVVVANDDRLVFHGGSRVMSEGINRRSLADSSR